MQQWRDQDERKWNESVQEMLEKKLQSHMLLIWSMSLVKSVILVALNYVADFGGRKCSSHDHMWPSGKAF
jgi:hypothetical protein